MRVYTSGRHVERGRKLTNESTLIEAIAPGPRLTDNIPLEIIEDFRAMLRCISIKISLAAANDVLKEIKDKYEADSKRLRINTELNDEQEISKILD